MSVVNVKDIEGVPVGLFRGAASAVIEDPTDLNDYESRQEAVSIEPDGDGGSLNSVFSSGFSSSPRSAMYQAWVFPELHPDERQPVLKNWSAEDHEEFWIKDKELM